MLPSEIIKKKRSGFELQKSEFDYFFSNYLNGCIADYQMSAFLMAAFFNGLSEKETFWLTQFMMNSGQIVEFDHKLKNFYVDKHSTGGVGDKTSLILAPIVSSLGIPVPMISGRGLGHTGGTLDKLESIPGFVTQLSLEQFVNQVNSINCALIGQTEDICPADKKLYALRDVTGTVENIPLICASIMSKKLAAGIDGLVADVKFGSGAFMKTLLDAEKLAQGLIKIAKMYEKKIIALLTNMNQPLGTYAGNVLEVIECLEVLENLNQHQDTRFLSLKLSAYMVHLATEKSFEESALICEQALTSGRAREQFERICQAQGGDLSKIKKPQEKIEILSCEEGYLLSYDVEKIGWLNVEMGAGRKKITDTIDYQAGIQFHKKIGDKVSNKDILFTIYGSNLEKIKSIGNRLLETVRITPNTVTPISLIHSVLK